MNKEEMIKQLEEANKYIGEFLFDCGDKVLNNDFIKSDDIDTDDVCETQNRVLKVLDALKGDRND